METTELKKTQRLSGSFSFCLPGLGQLYLRRYLRAAFFFLGFCLLEMQPVAAAFVPLWAIFSSVEAFRFSGGLPEGARSAVRTYLFASIASLALVLWILSFGPFVIPVGQVKA